MLSSGILLLAFAKPILVGYLPAWRAESFDYSRLAPLTDVIYFSVSPRADGSVDLSQTNIDDFPALRKAKAKYGFRLLLTCGGWERSQHFPTVAKDPSLRRTLILSLEALCEDRGFDGIDYDWEHPKDASEARAYAELIRDTKARFAPKKRLVTAAKASWQSTDPMAVQNLDRVHLMAYDHDGPHSTFEAAQKDVESMKEAGFSPDKIVLGVPLYGRNLKDRNGAKTYEDIVFEFDPKPDMDEVGGYSFNGPTTLQKKAKFVKESGLGGIMIWEVGQDAPEKKAIVPRLAQWLGLPNKNRSQ